MFARDLRAAGAVVALLAASGPSAAGEVAVVAKEAAAAPLYTVTSPRDLPDVKLAAAGTTRGQSAIAVNPKNANVFAAVYANQGVCWVRVSSNAGRTWTAAKRLPMPPDKPNCDIPAVIWASDGSRVYAAYSYSIETYGDTLEAAVLITSSTDKGLTWSPPRVALRYPYAYEDHQIGSIKLATPIEFRDVNWLYILANIGNFCCVHTYFNRSDNRGKTWGTVQKLVHTNDYTGDATTPSIAGGPGGQVLVAWGEAHWDPEDDEDIVVKNIYIKRSMDYGAGFAADVIAVPNTYGRTAVAVGALGAAHIIYTEDWEPSALGIYYAYSAQAPYTTWSAPIRLNDDFSANNFSSPALAVSACGSNTSVLQAAWIDDRAGPEKHNLYYIRKVAKTGEQWSRPIRVTGAPLTDTAGNASIAAGAGMATTLWGQYGDYYGSAPVWTSRIASGVSCP